MKLCANCHDPIVYIEVFEEPFWQHAATCRWYCDGSQTVAEPEPDAEITIEEDAT